MDLKQLKCFSVVAEVLHFGRAAHRMNILPTTLSRQIKLLEEDLGMRLLVRSTRHVELTTAGMLLQRDAKTILKLAADTELAIRQLAKANGQILRIGAIDSAAVGLLPELLGEYRSRFPDVETQLTECNSAQQLQMLLTGHLDLAFVRPPVRENSLRYEFLLYETFTVAMPEDHVLATKNEIDIQDLVECPLIVPARRVRPHSYKAIIQTFEAAGEQAKIVIEASERQTIISLVAAGIGIALVPSWVAILHVSGVTLRPLKQKYSVPSLESELGVAWADDLRSVPREAFLHLLRTKFTSPSAGALADPSEAATS